MPMSPSCCTKMAYAPDPEKRLKIGFCSLLTNRDYDQIMPKVVVVLDQTSLHSPRPKQRPHPTRHPLFEPIHPILGHLKPLGEGRLFGFELL